jgi:hypothetical protein
MRKFIVSALAAASILGAVSVANAGYWVPGPFGPQYVPSCNLIWNGYVWVNVCG